MMKLTRPNPFRAADHYSKGREVVMGNFTCNRIRLWQTVDAVELLPFFAAHPDMTSATYGRESWK